MPTRQVYDCPLELNICKSDAGVMSDAQAVWTEDGTCEWEYRRIEVNLNHRTVAGDVAVRHNCRRTPGGRHGQTAAWTPIQYSASHTASMTLFRLIFFPLQSLLRTHKDLVAGWSTCQPLKAINCRYQRTVSPHITRHFIYSYRIFILVTSLFSQKKTIKKSETIYKNCMPKTNKTLKTKNTKSKTSPKPLSSTHVYIAVHESHSFISSF